MLHAIRSALGPVARVGKEITYLPTCPSTNDLLKAMAEAGAGEGTVLVAGEQTRGKGRLGRSFTSAAGKGVYLSALLRPQLPPEKLLPLMGFTAEAMGRAVRRVAGAEAGIKWVNDLILNGKKICGILTESAFSAGGQLQYVVVGIGLNVNYETEDKLFGWSFRVADLPPAVAQPLSALMRMETYALMSLPFILCRFRRDVRLIQNGLSTPAYALDVDEALGLLVRYPDGTETTVRSGEASVRGLTGYVE